jgi:hypothetical protein
MSTGQLVQDSTGHVQGTRLDRQHTLKGVVLSGAVQEETITVRPTAKTIGAEPGESIRCWRNWPSDGEPVVVWCGSFKVPLTNWPEGDSELAPTAFKSAR